MAKDPAFLFYYQDFLVGTTFLTQAERGAYITILCHLADKGSLYEDEIICLCNGTFSAKLKSKLQVDNEGKYYNKRLLGEVIKRKEYAISRRNNRLGKDKKKKHMKKICKTYVKHMENEDIDENETVNTNKIEDIISDLNLVLGTSYKPNGRATRDVIQARFNEGFTVDDFKTVHRNMVRAWGADAKMCKFLRPITLYSNKFESYLNYKNFTTKLTETGVKAYIVGQEWLKKQEAIDVR